MGRFLWLLNEIQNIFERDIDLSISSDVEGYRALQSDSDRGDMLMVQSHVTSAPDSIDGLLVPDDVRIKVSLLFADVNFEVSLLLADVGWSWVRMLRGERCLEACWMMNGQDKKLYTVQEVFRLV